MFAYATAQNDHPSFLGVERNVIQRPYISNDVDDKTRRAERVKVDHVAERAISQSRAKYRDVVLRAVRTGRDGAYGVSALYAQ